MATKNQKDVRHVFHMPKTIESFIRSTKSVAMTYFTIESHCVVFIQIVECRVLCTQRQREREKIRKIYAVFGNLWLSCWPFKSQNSIKSCEKCFDGTFRCCFFFLVFLCCLMYNVWILARSSQLVNRRTESRERERERENKRKKNVLSGKSWHTESRNEKSRTSHHRTIWLCRHLYIAFLWTWTESNIWNPSSYRLIERRRTQMHLPIQFERSNRLTSNMYLCICWRWNNSRGLMRR